MREGGHRTGEKSHSLCLSERVPVVGIRGLIPPGTLGEPCRTCFTPVPPGLSGLGLGFHLLTLPSLTELCPGC